MTEIQLSAAIPQLPTGDINKTEEFFTRLLGFQLVAKLVEHNFLIVQRGPAEIHFWQTSEEEAKKLGSNSSCYIKVKGIETLFSEFKEKNAPFRYELTKQPWGMHEMQIDDPYGNAIRFGEEVN